MMQKQVDAVVDAAIVPGAVAADAIVAAAAAVLLLLLLQCCQPIPHAANWNSFDLLTAM